MKMTPNEKSEIVVRELLFQAGNLVEFSSEYFDPEIDAEFVRKCLATWLRKLPGDTWDIRLNKPVDYSAIPGA